MKKSIDEYLKLKEKENYERNLVSEVKDDFKKRQQDRRNFESRWQLCMNFVMGNQFCTIGRNNEIEEFEKQFFWQEKEAFNHILPTLEVRLAKLERVRPTMNIIPATSDEKDLKTAKISKKIVNSIYNKKDIKRVITDATNWSEICGTSFYKVVWNNNLGNSIVLEDEKEIKTGEIDISVCTPFEIFPESSSCENINDNRSIIHAKAYHVDTIKNIWGVDVNGGEIDVFSLDNSTNQLGGLDYTSSSPKVISTKRSNYALVLEKYELPSANYPNGRLIIIAGDKLVYDDELPYENGEDGTRGFPFIKQTAFDVTGCFWGGSVVERLIPIQRAYNAVKNRKHEYLNRLSMGVLTVEDGSVDLDNLEEEGLSPGKILVYRQGASAPRYMTNTTVPTDFVIEEDRLLNEFTLISGVSDLMRNMANYKNMSGTALQLLIEQDDSRISTTAEKIRNAIKQMAEHTLRLYKQFATVPRLAKISSDNGMVETFYFNSSDISSDDVVFETESEISDSLAQRRNMVFELLNAGLLNDEEGKLSNRIKVKVLDLLGFGVWENAQDINELHTKKAGAENVKLIKGEKVEVMEIDDHKLHIAEHTAFALSGEFEKRLQKDSTIKEKLLEHIRQHKKFNQVENMISDIKGE